MASIEVLNATQANVEAPVEIQLSLGNPIYRGPKGNTPVKGVDYFTQEDINNIVAQIEGGEGIDLANYATKAYVDEAIGDVIVEETDPTVPEWAKQETKPTYTANEVGALPADTVLFSGNYEDLSNKPTIPVVPTNVSSFTNDAGYLTTHQSLTDYATKSYVETAIRGAETGLLKREVVQALPVSEIDDNTIYMVPKTGSTGDVYDEYLYINNTWEHIGSTDVDLTGYATESWVNNLINPVILKRPLRVITVNLGAQDETSSQINGNLIYRLEIPGNQLFPSDEDYHWANNFLVYGFKEYPFVFKIVYKNSTRTLYLYPYSALINYYNWDEVKGSRGYFIIINGGNTPMLNYVRWGDRVHSYDNGTANFSNNGWGTPYPIEWTYDLDAPGAPTTKWINNKLVNKQDKLTAGPGIKIEDTKIKSTIPYYIQYSIHNLLSINSTDLLWSQTVGLPNEKYVLPQAETFNEMVDMLKEYGIVQCNNVASPSNSVYGPSLQEINTALDANYDRIYCYNKVGKIIKQQYQESSVHKEAIILLTGTNEIIDFINGENTFIQWVRDEIYKVIGGPNPNNFTVLTESTSLQGIFQKIDTNLSQRPIVEYLSNSDIQAIWEN